MTFGQALAAMKTALSAANLERTGVTYEVLVGDEHLDANGSPPRIVIVPMHANPKGARLQAAVPGPRAIAGELHTFQAELWALGDPADNSTVGKDYVAVSTMRATFTKAMRDTFGTNFLPMDGQWSSTQGESMEELGRKYVLLFTLDQLSLDAAPLAAEVLHTDTNTGITNPGQDWVDP
jgi:hypothetical protein